MPIPPVPNVGVMLIDAEVISLAPEFNGNIVYALTAPPVAGGSGFGILAPMAQVCNNSNFAIRLHRVVAQLLSEDPGGAVVPAGPAVTFDSADIGSPSDDFNNSNLDSVFGSTAPEGISIAPNHETWVHIQKRASNRTYRIFFGEGTVDAIAFTFHFTDGAQTAQVELPPRSLAPHINQNGTAQGSYIYPFKARDLRPGELYGGASPGVGSHHQKDQRYAYDTGCGLLEPDGDTNGLMEGTSGAFNFDYRVFGKPIYAMADGVISEVVNHRHDNDPRCRAGQIGENRVVIQHGAETVKYLHLMRGSIAPALDIDVPVTEGQFLGLCGNSGDSTDPHGHFHVIADDGRHRPLHFRDTHVVDETQLDASNLTGPWVLADGRALPMTTLKASLKPAIWPSREAPRAITRGPSGGSSDEPDILTAVAMGPQTVVTAQRELSDGRLRLLSWGLSGDDIDKLGDSGDQAGDVGLIAITEVQTGQIVTAVQTSGGGLKLINWAVGAGGTIRRTGDSETAGSISLVTAAHMGLGIVVTAVRTSTDRLKLIAWDCSDDDIVRLGDSGDDDPRSTCSPSPMVRRGSL